MPDSWRAAGWHLLPIEVDPYGVVAVEGALTPARLLDAYTRGIFPWPQDGYLVWFCPHQRGVLFFKDFHVSKRTDRYCRHSGLHFTWDQCFSDVIQGCATAKRKSQSGTWITSEMLQAYNEFHRAGWAHSLEAWRGDRLVGGLYGVDVNGVFSAESVFATENNVSKFCLIELVKRLQIEGREWMDVQMLTPLTQGMGAVYISRPAFLALLPSVGKLLK